MSEEKKSNVVAFNQRVKELKQREARPFDLKAELDYRTTRLLELLDEHNRRIDLLEANVTTLVRALQEALKRPT